VSSGHLKESLPSESVVTSGGTNGRSISTVAPVSVSVAVSVVSSTSTSTVSSSSSPGKIVCSITGRTVLVSSLVCSS